MNTSIVARNTIFLALTSLAWLACSSSNETQNDPTETGAGGTGGSTATASPQCGDGARQGTEACDGDDLDGKTCSMLGFAAGFVGCKSDCTFDSSHCEICDNGMDDDGDGEADCDDPDCAALAQCSASCDSPFQISGPVDGSGLYITGAPDDLVSSCMPDGHESTLEWLATTTGTFEIRVDADFDCAVAVRTVCTDAATEIECTNANTTGEADTEMLLLDAEAGQSYTIVVEGAPDSIGEYRIHIGEEGGAGGGDSTTVTTGGGT